MSANDYIKKTFIIKRFLCLNSKMLTRLSVNVYGIIKRLYKLCFVMKICYWNMRRSKVMLLRKENYTLLYIYIAFRFSIINIPTRKKKENVDLKVLKNNLFKNSSTVHIFILEIQKFGKFSTTFKHIVQQSFNECRYLFMSIKDENYEDKIKT